MFTCKRHIVFVINSLVGGGAERALMNIIGGLQSRLEDFQTTLILLDSLPETNKAPAFVEKIVLDSRENFVSSLVGLTATLRRIQPDLVVSFLSRANCANVLASRLIGYPAIISERVHTSNHFGGGYSAAAQKAIISQFYRRAGKVLAVSSGVGRDLAANFHVAQERITIVHNPIDTDELEKQSRDRSQPLLLPPPYIVAVGRLTPNKNFAMTLRGYAQSGETAPLVILGEGPERTALEGLVAELGLRGRVLMPGYVANPFPIVANAKYLVSSSNAEGFPNVLVEAMALGRPVIATDCEAGPADILSPERQPEKESVTRAAYGLLVPVGRADLLAEAINLFQDDACRADYAAQARTRVQAYAPERIIEQYWRVIEGCLQPEAANEEAA